MKLTNIIIISAVGASAALALQGCNMYGKFKMSKQSELTAEYAQALQQEPDPMAFGNMTWQQVFTDPVLADLINQALQNNTNLQNAKLNVDIAHAQLKGARLSFLPSVALAPNASVSHFENGPWTRSYQIPLSVSWEVDIFGRLLNTKRAAKETLLQSQAYAQAVRSQIISAVANTYYGIATLEQQLELSRSTAENWKETVQVMRDLKEAGRGTEVAVVQSEAQYYGIQATITDLEVSLNELNNTMSLLLNVMPQTWAIEPLSMLPMPQIHRDAIPMRELAARPDVQAAEHALAAAYYTTAGARSAFYPSLNITANGGFTNMLGSMIVNPGKFFLNLAGQLTAPLFSRGANIARLEAAKAQQQQQLNTFEYTLMSASAEVSNAMTLYQKSVEKQQLVNVQVADLSKAVDYTKDLLKVGNTSTTYLDVLTAQTNLLGAQTSEITARNNQARALINLYQSLGGGR